MLLMTYRDLKCRLSCREYMLDVSSKLLFAKISIPFNKEGAININKNKINKAEESAIIILQIVVHLFQATPRWACT